MKTITVSKVTKLNGKQIKLVELDDDGVMIPIMKKIPAQNGPDIEIETGTFQVVSTDDLVELLEAFVLRACFDNRAPKQRDSVMINQVYMALIKCKNLPKTAPKVVELDDDAYLWLCKKIESDTAGVLFFASDMSTIYHAVTGEFPTPKPEEEEAKK